METSLPTSSRSRRSRAPWISQDSVIALTALAGIGVHLLQRYGPVALPWPPHAPLLAVLLAGGIPLVLRLAWQGIHGQFGSDHLAGISIVASVLLDEYLAGAIVVLMLSGGETLEQFAVAQATSVLRALAARVPTLAHRRGLRGFDDVPVGDVVVGDELSVLPHEVCPVDGEVVQGHGAMDESYLTGEPFTISKGPGSTVLSGAINGASTLAIRATKVVADSRYAQIMEVMQEAEQRRPRLRRIGDQLGAWYTPVALAVAALAWWSSGSAVRFLSVIVVATPCPLLIAIPVAIIGSISTAARRGIIIKDPTALEQLALCRTMILDKTGTLTYGRPTVTDEYYVPPFTRDGVLPMVAALEQYSRHPLAGAITRAATEAGYPLPDVEWTHEEPGAGLRGKIGASTLFVTGRFRVADRGELPPALGSGLECVVLLDDRLAAIYQFHDMPRDDSEPFVTHLGPRHGFTTVMLVSGDREVEARRLADLVAITEVHANTSPEEKVAIVRREAARAKTIVVGDGINDAPALMAATVGIAFGHRSDVTAEAAGVVIVDSSLSKVDELLHMSRRLRCVALQSAVGGMLLSGVGMAFAAAGALAPVAGAVTQEVIDLVVVLNALRTARPPAALTDFRP